MKVILNQESIRQVVKRKDTSNTMPFISSKELKRRHISISLTEEQQTIVKAIQEEMQFVSSNKWPIEMFDQKIKTKKSMVWGVKVS